MDACNKLYSFPYLEHILEEAYDLDSNSLENSNNTNFLFPLERSLHYKSDELECAQCIFQCREMLDGYKLFDH